ncbi:MAG: efflux RND transporter permease subunit, partial [Verrucomicrobiota bacterium]
ATELRKGTDIIPVMLRSEDEVRRDLGRLDSIQVSSYTSGQSVPLLSVARPRLEWQPSLIQRRDQTRNMTLLCAVNGRYANEVMAELRPQIDAYQNSPDWPAGFDLEYGGENESSGDAQSSILSAFPLAFSLLALVLIGQFNSIRRPLIIGLTVPPMIIGITWGMLATNAPFGFMAMLGMISLMGIIVNNAIMMIDRIEFEREAGQTLQNAIVIAAMRRLRPIVMTACTTSVGLFPLSLQGGEFWRPMANCIIFGLAFSTLLTLLLCPVLYSIFFRARYKDYTWSDDALVSGTD